ncbi:MAG: N-6 DNA methylase [Anaerolineae bacterium]|nr:N-6 DNA methylase [Anaerolineae bacterium]
MAYLFSDLLSYSLELGQNILSQRSDKQRKIQGQFLTPIPVARFMAKHLGEVNSSSRVLDPAIGSGVLVCALLEQIVARNQSCEIWLDGYETDDELCQAAKKVVTLAQERSAKYGVIVHSCIQNSDFILDNVPAYQPHLLLAEGPTPPGAQTLYDYIISNPPYFKLNSKDRRAEVATGQIKGHTNIYTLFLALSATKLAPQGKACFIVPRSFCSGAYFSALRQELIEKTAPYALHLFESREAAFKDDAVLQENIIISFAKKKSDRAYPTPTGHFNISTSKGTADLENSLLYREVSLGKFLGKKNGSLFFRLPVGELDEQIIDIIDGWPESLNQLGLNVSTGPVVPFRSRSNLTDKEAVKLGKAVPLLWMHNVKRQKVDWPALNGSKPQGLYLSEEGKLLSTPTSNYVLLRRFSAKEEPRRLIAAPFLTDEFSHYGTIGLENHLNYIYRKRGQLSRPEVVGLAALLNSALIDRYFRITNGNTQVNATEIRALPLPPLEVIQTIGQALLKFDTTDQEPNLEPIVFTTLRNLGFVPQDFPAIRETRFTMGKIQEAQDVLKSLGLPANQQNEMSALTLLVMAQLSESTPWEEAKRQSVRIHDILLAMKDLYDRDYAENTRETVRRQVIHQFVQAGLVLRNPDDPRLPTNSPRTHYALSDAALATIRTYQTDNWTQSVQAFNENKGALLELYQKRRQHHRVPLTLANGEEYHLSPGRHNELQVAIIEEFGPRFAPGATLLYLGDTENKMLIFDKPSLEQLGIPTSNHDKLPDILLYDSQRNWLFLIEAVTSHGPVSPKRYVELETMLEQSSVGRIYVSAFLDFATFRGFLSEIAWETEVWLAEMPDHLIHFNGDRFLGPRTS